MNSKLQFEGGSGKGATIAQELGKSDVMPSAGGDHDEIPLDNEPFG